MFKNKFLLKSLIILKKKLGKQIAIKKEEIRRPPVSEKYYRDFDKDFTYRLDVFRKKHFNHLLNKNTKPSIYYDFDMMVEYPPSSETRNSNNDDSDNFSKKRKHVDCISNDYSRKRRHKEHRSENFTGRRYSYSRLNDFSREERVHTNSRSNSHSIK
uniref:Unspecified product n=1 Tax=Strongyloides venezuelensis TaxID=75913 RepID=A0A0K0FMF3_STRVS